MLLSTSPYHFSSPAIYQMFVGRRTDKGMCLTLSITDNWTQYAATWKKSSLYETVTGSLRQPGLNLPKKYDCIAPVSLKLSGSLLPLYQ